MRGLPRAFVAMSGDADESKTWQMGRVVKTFSGHVRRISSISVSEDAKYLYTGSVDGTARRWDVRTGTCMMVYENNGFSVTCIHHSGKFLYTGGASFNNTIRKWDVKFGKELGSIEKSQGHRSGITALRTDENHLYSGSWDGTVRSWLIKDCSHVNTYEGHQAGSQIKALSVFEDKVATGSTDKTCRIFDKATTECKVVIELDHGICGVLLIPNSIFVGTKDAKGYKYSTITGKKELDLAEPTDTFTDLGPEHPSSGFKEFCMSSVVSGGCVAAANRSSAHMWDAKTGEYLHTLYEADNVDVNALCLAVAAEEELPGRSYAFTGLDDNTAHVYTISEPVTAATASTAADTAAPVIASPAEKVVTPEGTQPQGSPCCVVS